MTEPSTSTQTEERDDRSAIEPGPRICPFCGSARDPSNTDDEICPRCTMPDTPGSRRATRVRIGPWYVLQSRNPAAPGMKFEVLLGFLRKGQVTRRSIVRGPTTDQLWCQAVQVRGLSREFGVCWSCTNNIDPTTDVCPQCGKNQSPPPDPDTLLELPDTSRAPIYREIPQPAAPPPDVPPPAPPSSTPPRRPDDVLMSIEDLAGTFQLGAARPSEPRRARSRWGIILLVLVLIALAIAAGAVFALWK